MTHDPDFGAREGAAAPAQEPMRELYQACCEERRRLADTLVETSATLTARDAALQDATQALHACQPFMKHPPTCELERLPFNARVNMTAHLCGLSGYNPMTDDCPGCDDPHYRAIECTCGFAKVWARLRATLAPQEPKQ